VSSNPIDSVDSAPFATHPLLTPARVVFDNTSILCVLSPQGVNNTVSPLCCGCSTDDGNNLTVFRKGSGRSFCEEPTILRLHVLSAGQYIPFQSSLDFETLGVTENASVPTYARHSRPLWALEQRYRIAPINITRAVVSRAAIFNWTDPIAADTSNDVVPTFQLVPLPRGFFIDTTTGELIGQPEVLGTNLSTLYAQYVGAESAAVASINFTVLHQDTAVASFGPNGKDCSNAAQRVDAEPFNQAFECDCALTSITATGDNCEQELAVATSTSSNVASSVPLYAAVGAIVALVVVTVVLLRYRRYKADHSPADLSALQDEILSSLGIGTAFDIGPREFGVSLTLPDLCDLPHVTTQRVEDAVREALRVMIDVSSRAFRTTSVGPKRNAVMAVARLSIGAARVKVEANKTHVLVVFARPESSKDGIEEDVVAGLQMAADRGQFTVGNGWVVTEVSVAVPRCVPREMDRSTIVRLNDLGEGNFAEVVKVRACVLFCHARCSLQCVRELQSHSHHLC
jgi:hypothetical protein